MRDSISVITVELAPRVLPFTGNWHDIRRQCLQIIQPCILRDKDAVLPAIGDSPAGETLRVVVSTDEDGAKVVADRIRDRLERSDPLKTSVFTVSSVGLKLSQNGQQPTEIAVQEVADSITEMSMTTLRRHQASAN